MSVPADCSRIRRARPPLQSFRGRDAGRRNALPMCRKLFDTRESRTRGARGRGPGGAHGPGADTGGSPQNGATPLYVAAHNGHLEVAQLLVQAGADKDAPNSVREGRGGEGMLGAQTGFLCFCGLQQGC